MVVKPTGLRRAGRRDNTAEQLYRTALGYALNRGYRFGLGADSDLQQFARAAAATKPSGAEVREFRLRFVRVVEEMIAAAEDDRVYSARHPGEIGEQTLSLALQNLRKLRLCPFPPFC